VKPATFHQGASADLEEAVAWYERLRAGLGDELRFEVECAVERIENDPSIGILHGKGQTRFCKVKRFPYLIYYAELADEIWIAAIAHGRRRPGYWRRRKPE
jgi:toxin ParE1/3/4